MYKNFNYKNLSFPVSDDKKVMLEVRYISNGNTSQTFVNRPGNNDPEMSGAGIINIGKGHELRNETVYIVTAVDNIYQPEDTIEIKFLLNDTEVLTHSNQKSVTKSANIILHLKFPTL